MDAYIAARDLSGVEHVYLRVDGIHVDIRG